MKDLLVYIEVCAIGGVLFYLANAVESNRFDLEILLKCAGFGALGGAVPALIVSSTRREIPIIHSWAMLAFIIYTMNYTIRRASPEWQMLLFGYVTFLLWEGYHSRLQKF